MILKRLWSQLFSNETLFVLFLFAGYFKAKVTFLPDYLDLTVLLLVTSLVSAMITFFKNPTIPKNGVKTIYLYGIYISALLLGLLYTDGRIYAMDKTIRFIVITGWSFVGAIIIIRNEESIKRFLNAIMLFAIAMSLTVIYTYFTETRYFSYSNFTEVWGSNYLAVGRTMGIAILTIIGISVFNDGKKSRLIWLLPFIFSILVSGGRMPIISLVITFFFIVAITTKIVDKKIIINKGSLKLFVSIVIVSFSILYIASSTSYFSTTLERLALLVQEEKGSSVGDRETRIQTALWMIEDSFVLGKGTGSFPLYYSDKDEADYPHNIFLESYSELGILGVASILILIINGLKNYKASNHKYHYSISLIFVYLLLNACVSGDINDNRVMFTFLAVLSISPFIKTNEKLERDEEFYEKKIFNNHPKDIFNKIN